MGGLTPWVMWFCDRSYNMGPTPWVVWLCDRLHNMPPESFDFAIDHIIWVLLPESYDFVVDHIIWAGHTPWVMWYDQLSDILWLVFHSVSTGWPWRRDRLWRATTLGRQLPLCVHVLPTVSSRSLLWRTFSLDSACIWSRVEWPLQMEPSLKVGEHSLNITVYVSCPLATSYDHIWLYPKKRRESSYLARVSINMCESWAAIIHLIWLPILSFLWSGDAFFKAAINSLKDVPQNIGRYYTLLRLSSLMSRTRSSSDNGLGMWLPSLDRISLSLYLCGCSRDWQKAAVNRTVHGHLPEHVSVYPPRHPSECHTWVSASILIVCGVH